MKFINRKIRFAIILKKDYHDRDVIKTLLKKCFRGDTWCFVLCNFDDISLGGLL